MKSGYVNFKEIIPRTKLTSPKPQEITISVISGSPDNSSFLRSFPKDSERKHDELFGFSQDEIKEMFDKLDGDSSGSVSSFDFKAFLENQEYDKPSSSFYQKFAGIDLENITDMNFEEFAEVINNRLNSKARNLENQKKYQFDQDRNAFSVISESNKLDDANIIQSTYSEELAYEAKRIFEMADYEKTGFIDLTAIKQVIKNKEESYNSTIIDIITVMDFSDNRKISFDEFLEMIINNSGDLNFTSELVQNLNKTLDYPRHHYPVATNCSYQDPRTLQEIKDIGATVFDSNTQKLKRKNDRRNDKEIDDNETIFQLDGDLSSLKV